MSLPVTTAFRVRLNDIGAKIQRAIYDANGLVDLTGASAVIHLRKGDGQATATNPATVTVTGSLVTWQSATGDFDKPGKWAFEFKVTLGTGEILTTPMEEFFVDGTIA